MRSYKQVIIKLKRLNKKEMIITDIEDKNNIFPQLLQLVSLNGDATLSDFRFKTISKKAKLNYSDKAMYVDCSGVSKEIITISVMTSELQPICDLKFNYIHRKDNNYCYGLESIKVIKNKQKSNIFIDKYINNKEMSHIYIDDILTAAKVEINIKVENEQ